MKVRYVKKGEYQGTEMSLNKEYEVIGIEADYYRILNDSKEPYLYNPNQFELVDAHEPEFWVTEFGEDNEKYSYPKSWKRVGFFEDFFDGKNSVVKQFWEEYEKLFSHGKSV